MLIWQKPDIVKEIDKALGGIVQYDTQKLVDMLEKGRLATMTTTFIRDNAYNIDSLKRKYLNERSKFQNKAIVESASHNLELPAPIVIFIAGRYLLFSGFEAVMLAHRYNFPMKVWLVEEIPENNSFTPEQTH